MGSDQHIYLGPFTQVKQRPAFRKKTLYGCSNEECRLHGRAAAKNHIWCPSCGKPNGDCTLMVPCDTDTYPITGEALARVTTKDGIHTLVPNVNRGNPRDFSYYNTDSVTVDLHRFAAAQEMLWFETNFGDQLDRLREAFDDVKVGWGLLLYFR